LSLFNQKHPSPNLIPNPSRGGLADTYHIPLHHTASLGTAFLLLPSAATFQSSHRYSKGKHLSFNPQSHQQLSCITCALFVPTGVESFQQPLPFQRALQTAIYT